MQLWWEVVRSGVIAWGRLGPHLLAPSPGLIWSANPTWLVWSTLPTWLVWSTQTVWLVNGRCQIIGSSDQQIFRSSDPQVSRLVDPQSSDHLILRLRDLQNCKTAGQHSECYFPSQRSAKKTLRSAGQ